MNFEKNADVPAERNLPFGLETSCADNAFSVSVRGRLDTITAPQLLFCYQNAAEKINSIHVDGSNMTYITSAGMRALLMMYKSLDNKDNFHLINLSPDVVEMLELAGFAQFLHPRG